MKRVRAIDFAKKLADTVYVNTIERIVFSNVRGLGSGELPVPGSVTVICGPNGVGKSTMMDLLLSPFGHSRSITVPSARRRLAGATIKYVGRAKGKPIEGSFTFDVDSGFTNGALMEVPVEWLSPAEEVVSILGRLESQANIEELLDQYAPVELVKNELQLMRQVVGRDYGSVAVREVELAQTQAEMGERDEVVPYTIVDAGCGNYGTECMGLGEAALHWLMWKLRRLEENTIVFVEEPETFVSPKAQAALMNILHMYAVRKKAWIIVSSHSPTVVAAVPRGRRVLMERRPGGCAVTSSPDEVSLVNHVGLSISRDVLVCVEDERAVEVVRDLFRLVDAYLGMRCQIVVANGKDGVRATLGLPRNDIVRVIGLYDSDVERAEYIEKWDNAFVIPCGANPEEFVREMVRDASGYAKRLGVPESTLLSALSGAHGEESHDWLTAIAVALQVGRERLVGAAVETWLGEKANREQAEQLCESIRVECSRKSE